MFDLVVFELPWGGRECVCLTLQSPLNRNLLSRRGGLIVQ